MTATVRAHRPRWWTPAVLAAGIASCCAPVVAAAQQRPTARPPAAAEGAAPTPQLVAVRPREPLRFDAQPLVPLFYDRNFWPAILAGVDVAPPRTPKAAGSGLPGEPAAGATPPTTAPRPSGSAPGRPRPALRRRASR